MKALARTFPFTLLTLAAVIALVVTTLVFAGAAAWPWRVLSGAVTILLWAVWFGAYRLRLREDTGPKGSISPPDAARRRFLIVHVPFVFAFVFAITASRVLAENGSGFVDLAAVSLPVLVAAAWVWEFARMIRRADEMMKAAQYRALAIAGSVIVLGAAAWGLCSQYLGWPVLPWFMLLPAWAVAYGVAFSLQGVEP